MRSGAQLCAGVIVTLTVISTSRASDADRRWVYDVTKHVLMYATPDTDDVAVEMQCAAKNRITAQWIYGRDSLKNVREGQFKSVTLLSSEKDFLERLEIKGKLTRGPFGGWELKSQPTNADSILFKMIRWGGEIKVEGSGVVYTLSQRGISDLNKFQGHCGD